MSVVDIDENELNAKCTHFVDVDGEVLNRDDWFPISDLILLHKAEGGFFKG